MWGCFFFLLNILHRKFFFDTLKKLHIVWFFTKGWMDEQVFLRATINHRRARSASSEIPFDALPSIKWIRDKWGCACVCTHMCTHTQAHTHAHKGSRWEGTEGSSSVIKGIIRTHCVPGGRKSTGGGLTKSGGLALSVQPGRKHPHHKTPTACKHQSSLPLPPWSGAGRPQWGMAIMVVCFSYAFLKRGGLCGHLKLKQVYSVLTASPVTCWHIKI